MSLDESAPSGPLTFDDFVLDPAERRLSRGGRILDVSGRYLDALALLVRERGSLVTKDRFMDEVWRGIPVTDEALTQCIRSLRKALGDEAARPRYIETVPKHGYRFIAAGGGPVTAHEPAAFERSSLSPWQRTGWLTGAGALGAGGAGVVGGVLYGFVATQGASGAGSAASVLIVVLLLTVAVALIGGAGVAAGIAAGRTLAGASLPASVAGGAVGGLVVGALVRLLGLDAFNLLLGRAPEGMTGAGEGALLGAATGLAAWLALGDPEPRRLMRRMLTAGWVGALAGAAIVALGGRLLGGSLALLAERFPGSRLRLDALGPLFGERGYGPIAQIVTGAAEGALFAACVAGAMVAVCRRFGLEPEPKTV